MSCLLTCHRSRESALLRLHGYPTTPLCLPGVTLRRRLMVEALPGGLQPEVRTQIDPFSPRVLLAHVIGVI